MTPNLERHSSGQYHKTFLGIRVIYATGDIFPYDFDWGNADRNVITSKKFYNIGHRGIIYGRNISMVQDTGHWQTTDLLSLRIDLLKIMLYTPSQWLKKIQTSVD